MRKKHTYQDTIALRLRLVPTIYCYCNGPVGTPSASTIELECVNPTKVVGERPCVDVSARPLREMEPSRYSDE